MNTPHWQLEYGKHWREVLVGVICEGVGDGYCTGSWKGIGRWEQGLERGAGWRRRRGPAHSERPPSRCSIWAVRRGLAAFLALCIKHFGQPSRPQWSDNPRRGGTWKSLWAWKVCARSVGRLLSRQTLGKKKKHTHWIGGQEEGVKKKEEGWCKLLERLQRDFDQTWREYHCLLVSLKRQIGDAALFKIHLSISFEFLEENSKAGMPPPTSSFRFFQIAYNDCWFLFKSVWS